MKFSNIYKGFSSKKQIKPTNFPNMRLLTMVQELNEETFKSTIATGPVLVDFWAEWCGPCKMLAPVFEEVSKEYEGKLAFAKIDTQAFPNPASESAVSGIPCLILFKDGKEVDRIVGFAPKEQLKAKIDAILAKM